MKPSLFKAEAGIRYAADSSVVAGLHGSEMEAEVAGVKGSAAERLYRQLEFAAIREDSLRRQMVWNGERD